MQFLNCDISFLWNFFALTSTSVLEKQHSMYLKDDKDNIILLVFLSKIENTQFHKNLSIPYSVHKVVPGIIPHCIITHIFLSFKGDNPRTN